MKRIISLSWALAITSLCFIGCSKESEELNHYTTDTSGPTPTLEGFNQLTVTKPSAIALSENNNFQFTWSTGDKFSVFESEGEWIADMKIQDAAATVSIFVVEGDVRLDDDTKYTAVYPARSSDQTVSYEDYLTDIQTINTQQTQISNSSDHLKEESIMKITFKGDNPIAFTNQQSYATIKFSCSESFIPASLTFEGNDSQIYTLEFAEQTTVEQEVTYTAYMAINPVAESAQERSLLFTLLSSDNKELISKEIKTSIDFDSGSVYTIDLDNGTIEAGIGDNGGGGGSTGDDDQGTDNNTEDLNPGEGEWK